MSAPIIEVHNLVKEYRLGAFPGLRALANRLMGRIHERHTFRALDDVSFTVRQGEVIGIIGHNGAGKSTLLKLLCNITAPTSGRLAVRGRIAPLIEVGAGLVPDMTGRENIYLNAAILGLSRPDIESKIDGIIAFAELSTFIDTPVKRYSSGMQIRLGYAIATAIDAEILIIDEVLAVGDLQFQRKSIERMQRMIQDANRTVLIVGHNIRQLERVCTRMILLDHGRLVDDGSPAEVTNRFFDMAAQTDRGRYVQHRVQGRIESSGEIEMLAVRMTHDGSADDEDSFAVGEPINVELELEVDKRFDKVDMAIAFHTPDLMNIGISPLTASLPEEFDLMPGRNVVRCRFFGFKVLPGTFMLKVGIKDRWGQMIWTADNLHPFHVSAPEGANTARYSAITFVEFDACWQVTHRASRDPGS